MALRDYTRPLDHHALVQKLFGDMIDTESDRVPEDEKNRNEGFTASAQPQG